MLKSAENKPVLRSALFLFSFFCLTAFCHDARCLPGEKRTEIAQMAVWYVSPAGSAGNSGREGWENALDTIQAAVEAARGDGASEAAPAAVCVAEGIYAGAGGAVDIGGQNAESVIILYPGIHLYGGYAGTETDLSAPAGSADNTVVDGESARRCITALTPGAESVLIVDFVLRKGSGSEGGGVYAENARLLFKTCLFSDCSADFSGGAFYAAPDAQLHFENCHFQFNAAGNDGGAGAGADNASIAIENGIFNNNLASDDGGAVYLRSGASLSVSNSTFQENEAGNDGGALAGWNGAVSDFTDTAFFNNTGGGNGGALHMSSGANTCGLTGCLFRGNTGRGDGGAICFTGSGGSLTAENTFFDANTSGGYGGAVSVESDTASLLNCIFSGNQSWWEGGGLSCRYFEEAELVNCTFSGNVSDYAGGAVYSDDSGSLSAVNSVFLNSSPQTAEGGITITYSCADEALPGSGNLQMDPFFADAANGDFRLRTGSPCIDSGTALFHAETDCRGLPRPQGAGIDRGAFEMSSQEDSDILPADSDGDGLPDNREAEEGCDSEMDDAALWARLQQP
jgi:predicted outer membrane repeat protein